MSISGSIPVSMISIMALLPVFRHQTMKEAVVGKTLQQSILIFRPGLRNAPLQVYPWMEVAGIAGARKVVRL